MTVDVPLLVIGGGIGGMTAALALARAGFAAHIVERSPEFGEIGAGIQLAPNALRILDGLGVLPEHSWSSFHHVHGRKLEQMPAARAGGVARRPLRLPCFWSRTPLRLSPLGIYAMELPQRGSRTSRSRQRGSCKGNRG